MPNLLACAESICIFSCSHAIDLKIGTMVEGMYTGQHTKFEVDRITTKEPIAVTRVERLFARLCRKSRPPVLSVD